MVLNPGVCRYRPCRFYTRRIVICAAICSHPTVPGSSRLKSFVVYWLPVAGMMLLIFLASGSSASFSSSRHYIEPILRWFLPGITEHGVRRTIAVVRKSAHVGEYAVLSFLVWRALRKPHRNDQRPWTWKEPAIVLLGAALYAISDEWHQSFVPNRQGAIADVFIDLSGATLVILVVWLQHRRRARRLKVVTDAPPPGLVSQ